MKKMHNHQSQLSSLDSNIPNEDMMWSEASNLRVVLQYHNIEDATCQPIALVRTYRIAPHIITIFTTSNNSFSLCTNLH